MGQRALYCSLCKIHTVASTSLNTFLDLGVHACISAKAELISPLLCHGAFLKKIFLVAPFTPWHSFVLMVVCAHYRQPWS